MVRSTAIVMCLAAAVILAPAAGAQSPEAEPDLRQEIEQLRQQQEALKAEVDALKKRLEPTRPSAPEVAGKVLELGDRPFLGEADAELVLIELTDFQCPFCARHHAQTFPRLKSEFVDTGRLRYTSLDMPLASIHPQAAAAAEAARCAAEQDRYWEMRDRLYSNTRNLEPLADHAAAVGLNAAAFASCMTADRWTQAIQKDIEMARSTGARGTPSFILARVDPGNPEAVVALSFIRGAQPFAAFEREIEKVLAGDDAS